MSKGRSRNGSRLVVIETDELIRALIVRWLGEAGHAVVTGDPGSEEVALVIADIPDPATAEIASRDLGARYGAPVLAISGRFRREAAASKAAAHRLGVAKVLAKPFSGEELLAAVEECLGRR